MTSSIYIQHSPNTEVQFSLQNFNIDYCLQQKNAAHLSGGRGASVKFDMDEKSYVLRRYLRGGLMARIFYQSYLWLGLQNTRVQQEFKVLQYALSLNLTVANSVAFCVERHGLMYQQAIISDFISNQGTLADVLQQRVLSEQEWTDLADAIFKMHAAKINHADLNANNILLGEDGLFYIIDFDKAKIMSDLNQWPQHNVQRLLRSLNKIKPACFDAQQWQQFMRSYAK